MPVAARSKLCSSVSAWLGVFASIASFHKHLIECKNNDDNFSIEIEAIVRNVGNLRIKEALSIAKLHPQINSWLELNIEYIIN